MKTRYMKPDEVELTNSASKRLFELLNSWHAGEFPVLSETRRLVRYEPDGSKTTEGPTFYLGGFNSCNVPKECRHSLKGVEFGVSLLLPVSSDRVGIDFCNGRFVRLENY